MTNGEKLVDVLELLSKDRTASLATRETILFLLEDTDFSTDRVCRVASLMVICQKIFEHHPEALVQMLRTMKNPHLMVISDDES